MKKISVLLLAIAASFNLSWAGDQPARKLSFERDDAVWIANIDGTSTKRIARGQAPDLSPDGKKLVYNTLQATGQPAHRQLVVLDLTSGSTTLLKDIPSDNCIGARWSPDARRILFDFYVINERRIGVVNADGTGFRYVQESEPKHQSYWAETWAADGESFFAEDMDNLYRLDLNAKVLKKWKVEQLIPHGSMGGDVRMDASPDGKTLLMDVEMDEKECKDWEGPPPAIWTLDLASEKVTRFTSKTFYAWDCHWLAAPDSILCVSQKPGDNESSIYRMSTTGQGKDRKLLVRDARTPGTSR